MQSVYRRILSSLNVANKT